MTQVVIKQNSKIVEPNELIINVGEFELDELPTFREEFLRRESDDSITDVIINISSFGGCVSTLCGMVDLIRSSKKDVWTTVSGCALSAGAFLLTAGNLGKRIISPQSVLMYHPIHVGFRGTAEQLKGYGNFLEKHSDSLLEDILKNSKLSPAKYKKLLAENNQEMWLKAEEAVKYGFADEIGTLLFKEESNLTLEISQEGK